MRSSGKSATVLFDRQRGAIGIAMVLMLTVAVLAMAVALDMGRLYLERQQVQRIADLAALDAAAGSQDLINGMANDADLRILAIASAARNGFVLNQNSSIVATSGAVWVGEEGTERGIRQFASAPEDEDLIRNAVEVIVENTVRTSLLNNFAALVPGTNIPRTTTLRGRAVAQRPLWVAFSAGTTLLTVDTSTSPLLGPLLGNLLGVNAGLVGYQGIANLRLVTLNELGIGANIGTIDELLDTEITLLGLVDAAIGVLSDDPAVVSLQVFRTALLSSTKLLGAFALDLREILTIYGTGSESPLPALTTRIHLGSLLNAIILLANQENAISIPGLQVSLGQLVNVDLALDIIQPPRIAIGPVGCTGGSSPPCQNWRTEAKPSQLKLNTSLQTNLLNLVRVNLVLQIGAAEGVAGINSARPDGNSYEVEAAGMTNAITSNSSASIQLLPVSGLPVCGGLLNLSCIVGLDLAISGNTPGTSVLPGGIYRAGPPFIWPEITTISLQNPAYAGIFSSLENLLGNVNLTITHRTNESLLGGLLNALLGNLFNILSPIVGMAVSSLTQLSGGLVSALGDLTSTIIEPLLSPLLDTLGLGVNPMDIEIIEIHAGAVDLVI